MINVVVIKIYTRVYTVAKTWLRWFYDWITVIAAGLIGLPTLILQFLSTFDNIDLTPFIEPKTALKIVTAIAILKAILGFTEALVVKRRDRQTTTDATNSATAAAVTTIVSNQQQQQPGDN